MRFHDTTRAFICRALACLAIIACSLPGCGGGTTGSGDAPSVKVYGTVTDQQGRAVTAGTVSDLNGDTTTSIDTSGGFQLSAVSDDGTVALDVTAQGTYGSIHVKDLPSSAQSIAVKVVVDSVSGIVTLASVDIDVDTSPSIDISQSVRGTVTDSSGQPAKNVTASVVGARGSDKTDTAGSFTLNARSTTGTITLKVSYNGLTGESIIRGIPKDRSCTLRVKLSISIEAGQNPGEGDEDGRSLSVEVDRVSVS